MRLFHLLAETEKDVKDSPHPRFQLEVGLVRLAQLARLRPLDELISRLEALESRMGGRPGHRPPANRRHRENPSPLATRLENLLEILLARKFPLRHPHSHLVQECSLPSLISKSPCSRSRLNSPLMSPFRESRRVANRWR